MLPALLILTLLVAQIPLRPAEGGTVTGVIKDSTGKPVAGVRVAAVPLPDAIKEGNTAAVPAAPAAMSSLAETDTQGRYTLDGISQGRYYIAAGRLDQQTYYPGTLDMTAATIVPVMPGTTTQEIDFTLSGASAGRASGTVDTNTLIAPTMTIPLQVRAQNGGRVPVFAAGKFPELRLIGPPASTSVPLVSASVDVYGPTSDYQITIENLPEGYSIQSMTYGSKDFTKGTLKFTGVDFAAPHVSMSPVVTNSVGMQQSFSAADLVNWPVSPSKLTITLRDDAPAMRSDIGVRVKGRVPAGEKRSVYISGMPGTVYSDGTFEFTNVRPGLHMIASLDNLVVLGAMVAVGDHDVEKVELNAIGALTANTRRPREPEPIGSIAPGTVVTMATISGRVLEEISKMPIKEGRILVKGSGPVAEYMVTSEGRFEIPPLFPGTYDVDFEIFGYSWIRKSITVGTEDITLDLTSRRLY